MGDYTIFIIFGVLCIVFLVTFVSNRRKSKRRKSRKFMENYEKDKK